MAFDPGLLLPQDVDPWVALGLIVLSFFTSAITAALSLGGGMLMLSALVLALPIAAVVPVHGLVQLGSNSGRFFFRRHQVVWPIALYMAFGAIPGALIGGQFVAVLPERVFAGVIALFILVTAWVKLRGLTAKNALGWIAAGTGIGAIGMLLSATGPLTAVFMQSLTDRRALVATHAAVMVAQHLSKIAVFSAMGFALGAWLPLVAAMVLSGLVGTWAGGKLLDRLPETVFRVAFRLVLSAVALTLLYRSLLG